MSQVRVSQDAFEGPLDLLLYLIKQDEIDVYEISIERITRQYLEYLEQARELDVPLAGEFIVMAANLMYLKSRALLPKHVQPPEEEAEEDDPRWELIRQLIEYKKFKDLASHLGDSEAHRALLYTHRPARPTPKTPDDAPLDTDLVDLLSAFHRILERAKSTSEGGQITDDRWTVSEKIEVLRDRIGRGKRVRFTSLFREGSTKGEVIVTFLAILELMKIRELRTTQSEFLGDIELQRTENP